MKKISIEIIIIITSLNIFHRYLKLNIYCYYILLLIMKFFFFFWCSKNVLIFFFSIFSEKTLNLVYTWGGFKNKKSPIVFHISGKNNKNKLWKNEIHDEYFYFFCFLFITSYHWLQIIIFIVVISIYFLYINV